MNYIELSVSTTHEASELVCDILSNYSSEGVSVLDNFDVLDLERKGKTWDYMDDGVLSSSDEVIVKAYVSVDNETHSSDIEFSLAGLKQNCPFDVGSGRRILSLYVSARWLSFLVG